MVPSKKAVIFDLDGTLVDVEPLFVKLFNTLSPEFGLTPITPEQIPALKKMGAREFLKKRVKVHFWQYGRLIRRGKEEYLKRLQDLTVFPGMPEAIQELRSQGKKVGVLSSNSEEAIRRLLSRFGITVDFVYSSTVFGKARAIRKALRVEGIAPESVIYVGDEVRDVEACKQAGVDVVAVTWGLNDAETLVAAGAPTVNTPQELLEKIGH